MDEVLLCQEIFDCVDDFEAGLICAPSSQVLIGNPLYRISYGKQKNLKLMKYREKVNAIKLNCANKFIAFASNSLAIFDLEREISIRQLHDHDGSVTDVAWHHANPYQLISVSHTDGTVRTWDVRSHPAQTSVRRTQRPFSRVQYSPDCSFIACAGETISIFDLNAAQSVVNISCGSFFTDVVFNPTECLLVSASEDRLVRFWDVDTGECVTQSLPFESVIHAMTFHPNGQYLICATAQQINAVVWEPFELITQTSKILPDTLSKSLGIDNDSVKSEFLSNQDEIPSSKIWRTLDICMHDDGEHLLQLMAASTAHRYGNYSNQHDVVSEISFKSNNTVILNSIMLTNLEQCAQKSRSTIMGCGLSQQSQSPISLPLPPNPLQNQVHNSNEFNPPFSPIKRSSQVSLSIRKFEESSPKHIKQHSALQPLELLESNRSATIVSPTIASLHSAFVPIFARSTPQCSKTLQNQIVSSITTPNISNASSVTNSFSPFVTISQIRDENSPNVAETNKSVEISWSASNENTDTNPCLDSNPNINALTDESTDKDSGSVDGRISATSFASSNELIGNEAVGSRIVTPHLSHFSSSTMLHSSDTTPAAPLTVATHTIPDKNEKTIIALQPRQRRPSSPLYTAPKGKILMGPNTVVNLLKSSKQLRSKSCSTTKIIPLFSTSQEQQHSGSTVLQKSPAKTLNHRLSNLSVMKSSERCPAANLPDISQLDDLMRSGQKVEKNAQRRAGELSVLASRVGELSSEELLDAVAKNDDLTTFATLLRVYLQHPKSYTLGLNIKFLEKARALFAHPNPQYVAMALELLEMIIHAFGDSIRHGLAAKCYALGVDVAAEQRFERCERCRAVLLELRLNAPFIAERLDDTQRSNFDALLVKIDRITVD